MTCAIHSPLEPYQWVSRKLLGHTQVQTTARYAHLADDPMHSAAERVSGAIAGALFSK